MDDKTFYLLVYTCLSIWHISLVLQEASTCLICVLRSFGHFGEDLPNMQFPFWNIS